MMTTLIKRVKQGQVVLPPITDQTRGHRTHSLTAIRSEQVAAFLKAVRR